MPRVTIIFSLVCFSLQGLCQPILNSKKVCNAYKVKSDAPVIDGKLDETEWLYLAWINNFIQHEPYEGKEPSQETGFKILYDNDNIYVAIWAFDTNPDRIERRLTRRDDIEGDFVSIQLDTYYNQRIVFNFACGREGYKGER